MRYSILVVLFFTVLCCVKTQDTLWATWSNKGFSDSTRLQALHKMARSFLYNDPDSASVLAQMELDHAREIRDMQWIASAYNLLGGSSWIKGNFPDALDYFFRALDIRQKQRDSIGIAAAYNNIGNIFFIQGYYPRALEYYFKSLAIEEGLDNISGLGSSYINIGSLYSRLGEHQKGEEYFRKALAIHLDLGRDDEIGSCYHNLGIIHSEQGNLDSAKHYLVQSIDFLEAANDLNSLAKTYHSLAGILHREGLTGESLEYYRKTEEIREALGDHLGQARTFVERGNLYLDERRYQQASEQCLKGLEISSSLGAFKESYDACDCLYRIYRATGNNELALRYFEQANALKDSLAEEETRKQLQLLEFKREVANDSIQRAAEEREAELQFARQLEKERKGRMWLTYSGVALFLLSVLLLLGIRKARRSRHAIEQEKQRSHDLLLNVLPEHVARELLEKGEVRAREFDNITVLFTDFVKYTEASGKMAPQQLVQELDVIYRYFDQIVRSYGVEKIKTIGDAYMAAGGIQSSGPESVKNTVSAAAEMLAFIRARRKDRMLQGLPAFDMRVGIHTGKVVAGILGTQKFQYDIWGDTVNIANRIQRNAGEGQIAVSGYTKQLLEANDAFTFTEQRILTLKGVGEIEVYTLVVDQDTEG